MSFFSEILFFIAYYVIRYRREITRANLMASFPERDESEILQLEKDYYHHMADLLIEAIHNLYASKKSIIKHYRILNPEILTPYYNAHQSVILASAHYNNWEYMVTSLQVQLFHHGIGVGKPLNDKATAGYITRRRTRFGTQVVDQFNVRETVQFYDRYHVPCALMMLADQSPSNAKKSYWTQFLNHDTAFLYGVEYFARKYNYPVFYYHVVKAKRHYYEITICPMCLTPQEVPQYSIVEQYVRLLEKDITNNPPYWLWSHRRWKLHRPEESNTHTEQ